MTERKNVGEILALSPKQSWLIVDEGGEVVVEAGTGTDCDVEVGEGETAVKYVRSDLVTELYMTLLAHIHAEKRAEMAKLYDKIMSSEVQEEAARDQEEFAG